MVELFDNLSQFILTLVAGVGAGVLFYKSRRQVYFLLTCFYGTYTLGALYWTLHMLLFRQTPQIFYVSDLSWVASFIFLLTLELTLPTPQERRFRHPAVWISPLVGLPLMIFYCHYGDVLLNLLCCGPITAAAWLAIRGLLYARRQQGKARDMQYLHIGVLCMVFFEYCLWTSSCFWVSDTLTNPYFWFDFLLSASLFALLPATRKAVEA